MSEKLSCPGCNTYTSQRLQELHQARPCSNCGLSARATEEILSVRRRVADDRLKSELEAVLIRAGKAEGERDKLRDKLQAVRWALEDALKDDDG